MAAIKEDLKDIGLKIAKLRGQRNWAQADLAAVLDISRNAVGAMERGEADFKISRLISICNEFHLSPSEILPDHLAENSSLPEDLEKLEEEMSWMTPDQRSHCMTAFFAIANAFRNGTQ